MKLTTPTKIFLTFLVLSTIGFLYVKLNPIQNTGNIGLIATDDSEPQEMAEQFTELSIAGLRKEIFTGSDIIVEEKLASASTYEKYIVSYTSFGNKIYALMTIPFGTEPENGWPTIVFNHGYIPPTEYSTTERYVAYLDGFARRGYIVFKSDYSGHGSSGGEPTGAYGSDTYTKDILNAVESLKNDPRVDKNRIGMWGHSMGGHIMLRSMVTSKDIKVGVIWAGVVASYPDLLNNWRRRSSSPPPGIPTGARRWRDALTQLYGTPEKNPTFWNSISATSYLKDISGPIQLHHGTADSSVPVKFSQKLESQLKNRGKVVEYYEYDGDDHNLSRSFSTAMTRSVDFFDRYLK